MKAYRYSKVLSAVGMQRVLACLVCTCVAITYALPSTRAMDLDLDGWHTWQVDAIDDAPNWCCSVWHDDRIVDRTCNLDTTNYSHGSFEGVNESPKSMQIYARVKSGKTTQLRTLSPSCAVAAGTDIKRHEDIDKEATVTWLANLINPRSFLSSSSLAALSVVRGDRARNILVDTAGNNTHLKNRKDAIFWMGQVRIAETFEVLKLLMFEDPLPELREHAIFSVSQSKHKQRAKIIAKAGKTDPAASVRGKAWFWLAQTKSSNADAAILGALKTEKSQETRNEAIFALSQLSDELAVDALIKVVENRTLAKEDRKQALFWLAQHESDRAHQYLSSVFEE